MNAVIYARVSSAGDRQTTERQVADLKRYIAINDMELVATSEEKMSGAKENRPVLTECVEYCIANHIHTLCVSEISRLGRSTKIVVNTIDELTKAGVNVYIQNLPLCTLNADREQRIQHMLNSCAGNCHGQIHQNGAEAHGQQQGGFHLLGDGQVDENQTD